MNDLELEKLRLTSVCSTNPDQTRRWRVTNNNNVPVQFTWDVYNTGQSGTNTVPANSVIFFETTTVPGPNTTRIFVNGVQNDVKASSGAKCPEPTPTTRGVSIF